MALSLNSPNDPIRSIPPWAWAAVAAMAILLGWAFRVPMQWMYDRWTAPESYYSHGFLVPPIVAWLIWRRREKLAAIEPGTSWLGLALLLAGLMGFLLAGLLSIFSVATFCLLFMLYGMAGFLFGPRAMRELAFPAFILLFMIPLPLQIIADISLKLKLLATKAALLMLDGVGIIATPDGSTIYLEGAVLTVGNACSGLRSMIALLLLGVLFAYLSDLGKLRKTLLFASSIPIALAANVVRVFALCLIAWKWGSGVIDGPVHDISGYLIYVVALALLYLTYLGLCWRRRKPEADAPAEKTEEPNDAT